MRARVPLYRTNPVRSVLIDPDATRGAVVGQNLYDVDGNVVDLDALIAEAVANVGGATAPGQGQGLTTDDVTEGRYNLYYTAARFYADMKAQLLAGANITLTPNDGAQTVTVAASGGEQLFNLITDAGDAYLTEDGADLLVVT